MFLFYHSTRYYDWHIQFHSRLDKLPIQVNLEDNNTSPQVSQVLAQNKDEWVYQADLIGKVHMQIFSGIGDILIEMHHYFSAYHYPR